MFTIGKKTGLNSTQFNSLAIVLVLAILPFSIAIISSLGDSTNTFWDDSMKQTDIMGEPNNGSHWYNNGGKNFTEHYDMNYGSGNATGISPSFIDCVYIEDSVCAGGTWPTVSSKVPMQTRYVGSNTDLPMINTQLYQSHKYGYYGGTSSNYVGESGSREFSFVMNSQLFQEIKQDTALDALSFTMAHQGYFATTYYNDSSAVEIGFNLCVEFSYNGNSLEYCGNYETKNLVCYQGIIMTPLCHVGFELDFDFTSFETIEISELNQGNWSGTEIKLSFENFYRLDGLDFGGTPLPFAGDNTFNFGMQHKTVNAKEVGFLIKSGTIVLSIGVILLGIASTPYWDPLKQSFRGAQ